MTYNDYIKEASDKWHTLYISMILQNLDKPWNWQCLSINPNITIDHILKYPNLPWVWFELSRNPNITIEHIFQYP